MRSILARHSPGKHSAVCESKIKKGAPVDRSALCIVSARCNRLAGTVLRLVHPTHAATPAGHAATGACALLFVFLDVRH